MPRPLLSTKATHVETELGWDYKVWIKGTAITKPINALKEKVIEFTSMNPSHSHEVSTHQWKFCDMGLGPEVCQFRSKTVAWGKGTDWGSWIWYLSRYPIRYVNFMSSNLGKLPKAKLWPRAYRQFSLRHNTWGVISILMLQFYFCCLSFSSVIQFLFGLLC